MIRAAMIVSAFFGLWSCGDETLSGYGATGVVWQWAELDGQSVAARATLIFPEEGRIEGEAPCNRFSGVQTVPYPWFKAERIAATKRACPDLAAEAAFLEALSEMTLAELAGDVLILRNDAGREMVFRAEK